jgi:crotonobetainyl-CoA:carnitine CoA-transferase CaiB-like acyl-CoA transferase
MYGNGPLAGVILGHLGADVIKIEDSTQGGDASRRTPDPHPLPGGRTAFNEVMNWGKRSLVVNLKQESAREIVFDLLARADVFLTNNRTSTLERLGLTFEHLSTNNPRLIYAAATAYGSRGPAANRPGQDPTSQARAGLMWLGSPEGSIPYVHTGHFGDMGGATLLAYGVVAALFAR